ncbi:MAG TPA: hypothetical protein VFC29_02775, partial [Candidatus Limnocylindrales bacterium]|nr:hypothetical protein [Candidatus Limnocylindrales bacterium]
TRREVDELERALSARLVSLSCLASDIGTWTVTCKSMNDADQRSDGKNDVFTEVNPQVRFLGHTFIPPGTYNPQELDGALDHSKILGLTDSPSPKDKEWIKETLLGGNPETPATKFRIEGTVALVEGLGDKLSIADPDSNRCILSSIGSSIGQFTTTANDQPLIHRYITDAGVEKAKTEGLQRKDNDQ